MAPIFFCNGKGDMCNATARECWDCPFADDSGGVYLTEEQAEQFAQNPYWGRISKMADRQRVKGIVTYGQGLESNPADIVKRIENLQEELIDGLMYCEWIKDELKKMEGSKNGNLSE